MGSIRIEQNTLPSGDRKPYLDDHADAKSTAHPPIDDMLSEEEENHDEELAIFGDPEVHKKPTTQELHDEALGIINESLDSLAALNALVAVDLNPSYPPVIVDGRGDISKAKILDNTDEKIDCTVKVRPETVVRLASGNFEPRYGVNFGHISTQGSARVGVRFCDLIRPVGVQPLPPNPPPPPEDLPKPVTDYATAWKHLEQYGYCLIKDALSPEQVKSLSTRIKEQATCEDSEGVGYHDGGPSKPNQRVWNLQNKGKEFLDLLEHPIVEWFVTRILGEGFLISSYTANIARPGGKRMFMHNDQMPVNPAIREVTLGANIAWFLDEVTEENGGTRVLVGSHRGRVAPRDLYDYSGTVALRGPPGTALIFDSRLWHCTGQNTASGGERKLLLSFFVRFFLRPQENSFLSMRPETVKGLSDKLKAMLGYRVTGTLGAVQGFTPDGTMVQALANPVGELRF